MPWEGGCTWVREDKSCFIQVRPKPPLFYTHEEIIAHELVHAFRSHMNEPQFEEFIAWRTSKNQFRAFLGPIIERPFEVYIFFFSLLLPIFESSFFVLPFLLIFSALIRLIKKNIVWEKSKRKLMPFMIKGQKPEHLLVHLSDKQIKALSKMNKEEVLSFLKH